MIHSPMPLISFPFHSPAGIAYSPQWMNMPKRASRHHFIRASRCSGDSASGCAAEVDETKRQVAARQRSRFFIGTGPYPARTDDLLLVRETLWPTELTARSHSY